MNEKEQSKKKETQSEFLQWDKSKKLSLDNRQWELTKKSTQASNNLNYDINLTSTSVQNIFGENKFKIQYETLKKEEKIDKGQKRSLHLKIKINYKEISKLKQSKTTELKENINIKSEFIDIKAKNDNLNFDSNEVKINIKENISLKVNKGFNYIRIRKDAYGEKITKENKKIFRVSFLDFLQNKDDIENKEIISYNNKKKDKNLNIYRYDFANKLNKEFIEVIKIRSLKKYNLQLNDEGLEKAVCKQCGCLIF
jgi:hypothetical protein